MLGSTIPVLSFSLPQSDPGYNPVTGAFTVVLGSSLNIYANVNIIGFGGNLLTISGNQNCTVFDIAAAVTSATLSGLNIANGAGTFGNGGGINNFGTLEVDNSTFSNNSATYGGAINNNSGSVTLNKTVFVGNNAAQVGGAINSSGGCLTIQNHCLFTNNSTTAPFSSGGAISSSTPATVLDSTFTGNSATFGGAIETFMVPSFIVKNCTFTNNQARDGGAIDNFESSITVTNSTFASNRATVAQAGTTNVAGGGIENAGGTAVIVNCTFFGNVAVGDATTPSFGGAIENFAGPAPATLTVTNCTLSANVAQNGGGLDNNGLAILGNTIVAANSGTVQGPDVFGSVNSLGNNLIGATDGSSGWIGSGTHADLTGTRAAPLNAFLGPLTNNGGPTQTMALQPRSPAADAGNNALLIDALGNPLTTDQRGFQRIVNGRVDIGAFEVRSITTLVVTPASSIFGQSVTLVAAVAQGNQSVKTGTVNFRDGVNGAFLAQGVPFDSNGRATITVTGLTAGTHALFAGFGGVSSVFDASGRTVLATVSQVVPAITWPAPAAITAGTALGTNQLNAVASAVVNGSTVSVPGMFTYTPAAGTVLPLGNNQPLSVIFTPSDALDFATVTAGNFINVISVATTTSVAASANPIVLGQAVTFTATVSAVASGIGTPTGTVQFQIDGSNFGPAVALAAGSASLSTSALGVGSHVITAVYNGDGTFLGSSGTLAGGELVQAGIILLDGTGQGSLAISGNGRVDAAGAPIVVDSRSTAAVTISGNGYADATALDVAGNTAITGHGSFQGTVHNGQAPSADPLAALLVPAAPSATFTGASYAGNTHVTLQPGTYVGGIQLSGQAAVTLLPGLYYLRGGGLSVSGNATLVGTGVLIYNAPSNSSDAISISGNGNVTLTPSDAGTYAGIVIFQDRTSTAPLSVTGNGQLNVTGTIYAAAAAITIAGHGALKDQFDLAAPIDASLIAFDLIVSGNGTVISRR